MASALPSPSDRGGARRAVAAFDGSAGPEWPLLTRLRAYGFEVQRRRPGRDVCAPVAGGAQPRAALVLLRLPTAGELAPIPWLARAAFHPILAVSEAGSIAGAVKALQLGADDYFCEPIDMRRLIAAIETDSEGASAGGPGPAADGVDPSPSLDRSIWEYLNFVLAESGTLAEAARRLGLHRRSLRRMLAKHPPRR